VLQPAIDRGDIKIVADQMIPDWKNDLALNFAENSLTKRT
jgi:ABC-type xylose transport system substrate-binding protein